MASCLFLLRCEEMDCRDWGVRNVVAMCGSITVAVREAASMSTYSMSYNSICKNRETYIASLALVFDSK